MNPNESHPEDQIFQEESKSILSVRNMIICGAIILIVAGSGTFAYLTYSGSFSTSSKGEDKVTTNAVVPGTNIKNTASSAVEFSSTEIREIAGTGKAENNQGPCTTTVIESSIYPSPTEIIKIDHDNYREYLNLNIIVSNGDTKVVQAIKDRNTESAIELINQGAHINIMPLYSDSALFCAIERDLYDVVNCLIEKGVDMNQIHKHKGSPLIYATNTKKYDIAKLLIQKGADLDIVKNVFNYSAMDYSISDGNMEILELLIEKGASLKSINAKSFLRLIQNKNVEIFDLFVEKLELDLNQQIRDSKYTLLGMAVSIDNRDMVKYFIDKAKGLYLSLDAPKIFDFGFPPERFETAKLLIENGFKISECDKYRIRALAATNAAWSALLEEAQNNEREV